jgi:hypothetical protein
MLDKPHFHWYNHINESEVLFMEYIKCKARVTKKVYNNGDFYIWSIRPNEFPSPIELNQYGNASIVGELSYLSEGKDYDFILNDKGTTKYGHQYEVIDVPSISIQNVEDLTEQEKFEILMECTSSKRIANNILKGCPNFIELAITKGADAIDESKIDGVGKVYKSAYCRILVEKYKYYAFTHADEIKPYKLTISEAKALFGYYSDITKSTNALKEDPYFVLIEVLGRTFVKADYLILELRPELVDSDVRGEAIILNILKDCESEGSSRLDGHTLYTVVKEDYKNVSTIAPNLKNIAQSSPRIFYDEKSGDLSRMDTYIAEVNVADFVINKVKNSVKLDIDWSKYTHNEDGFDMTEQQSKALENFCNSNISLLTGYAGCVDKDTEFFNGHEWKKICNYTDGEHVLQYDFNTQKATLVRPLRYIKEPCDKMYHFVDGRFNNYDMMLSADHLLTLADIRGRIKEVQVADVIKNPIEYAIYYVPTSITLFQRQMIRYTAFYPFLKEFTPYDGYKYCFQVPSEHLVLRRNNKIFITHNCGKTTSIQGLIQLMEDNGMSYTLLTPTGKASKVLSEATHRSAQTIHRACFNGNIDTDVVIVDEASMINLEVMNMLINSITNPNVRVVFSLDNAQLTPIGVGKVISDLIETNIVPKTELTQVFRYTDDGSLFVATNIRNGKNFFTSDNVKEKGNTFSVSSNYKFIETSNDNLFNEVIRQYKGLISHGIKQDDILVMCPYNVSKIGNYAICNAIQEEFNPPKPNELTHKRKIGGTTIVFKKGDIVVNKKNNYSIPTEEGYNVLMSDSMLTEEDVPTSIVLNGQMGRIVQVVKEGLLIKFDEEILFFNKQNINNLLLGYSISTHSSQGSSAQYTISIVSDLCKRMLSKELIYVADTRCKKSHIDIGQQDAFLYALSHSDNQHRYTWLKEMLIQGYKN